MAFLVCDSSTTDRQKQKFYQHVQPPMRLKNNISKTPSRCPSKNATLLSHFDISTFRRFYWEELRILKISGRRADWEVTFRGPRPDADLIVSLISVISTFRRFYWEELRFLKICRRRADWKFTFWAPISVCVCVCCWGRRKPGKPALPAIMNFVNTKGSTISNIRVGLLSNSWIMFQNMNRLQDSAFTI